MTTHNRLALAFDACRRRKAPALIPFVMCGDGPTDDILDALVAGGAAVVELGIPFSDPTADGPVIQAAGLRALNAGMTLEGVLQVAASFRARHADVPLVLMGYYNPIFHMGHETFCKRAKDAGVDGVIVVDLPPEEEDELTGPLRAVGIHLVRLIAPTSLASRLPLLVKHASGYVYAIAIAGITGATGATADAIRTAVAAIRTHTALPVAVGFGIKTAEDAGALRDVADGVVVGSALIEAMHASQTQAATAKTMMDQFRSALA